MKCCMITKEGYDKIKKLGYVFYDSEHEPYRRLESFLKEHHPWLYHMYVDMEIKGLMEADEEYKELLEKKAYKSLDFIERKVKVRLIKEIYGLEGKKTYSAYKKMYMEGARNNQKGFKSVSDTEDIHLPRLS